MIRQCLSEVTKTLVFSLVLCRLGYCNALLAGCPQVVLDKLERVNNCSARLICKALKCANITSLFYDLHWLPVSSRIEYKIALVCFNSVSGTASPYLLFLVQLLYTSLSCFISTSAVDTRIFRVPRMGRRSLKDRAVKFIGPVVLSSRPLSDRHLSSLSSFNSEPKTDLFSSAYRFVVSFLSFYQPHQ